MRARRFGRQLRKNPPGPLYKGELNHPAPMKTTIAGFHQGEGEYLFGYEKVHHSIQLGIVFLCNFDPFLPQSPEIHL